MGHYGNGHLIPLPGTAERLRYTYWLHFAEGPAIPQLLLKLIFGRIPRAPMPFFVKQAARGISRKVLASFVNPNLKRQLDYMENELDKHAGFAAPEFSATDIQMSFPIATSGDTEDMP